MTLPNLPGRRSPGLLAIRRMAGAKMKRLPQTGGLTPQMLTNFYSLVFLLCAPVVAQTVSSSAAKPNQSDFDAWLAPNLECIESVEATFASVVGAFASHQESGSTAEVTDIEVRWVAPQLDNLVKVVPIGNTTLAKIWSQKDRLGLASVISSKLPDDKFGVVLQRLDFGVIYDQGAKDLVVAPSGAIAIEGKFQRVGQYVKLANSEVVEVGASLSMLSSDGSRKLIRSLTYGPGGEVVTIRLDGFSIRSWEEATSSLVIDSPETGRSIWHLGEPPLEFEGGAPIGIHVVVGEQRRFIPIRFGADGELLASCALDSAKGGLTFVSGETRHGILGWLSACGQHWAFYHPLDKPLVEFYSWRLSGSQPDFVRIAPFIYGGPPVVQSPVTILGWRARPGYNEVVGATQINTSSLEARQMELASSLQGTGDAETHSLGMLQWGNGPWISLGVSSFPERLRVDTLSLEGDLYGSPAYLGSPRNRGFFDTLSMCGLQFKPDISVVIGSSAGFWIEGQSPIDTEPGSLTALILQSKAATDSEGEIGRLLIPENCKVLRFDRSRTQPLKAYRLRF